LAFEDFTTTLYKKTRFFNQNHKIFSHIKALFEGCSITLTPNDFLFRARKIEPEDFDILDKEDNFLGFAKKDSFVPKRKDMRSNRANSSGIPCLYAARDEKTAISEIRPFLCNEISIATIRPVRNLKLFDLYFSLEQHYNEIIKPPHSDFWFNIALKYSVPYENSMRNEYLLTQCISEYVQLEGFDGIQYASSLNEGGKNIVIFNCKHEEEGRKYEICEPICSTIRYIKRIEHYFE